MTRSQNATPFIPPRPGTSPAVVPSAMPTPAAGEGGRAYALDPYGGYPPQPQWAAGPNPYAAHPTQPQAPHRTPYRADGAPLGQGHDPGTYFNRPPHLATPAANNTPMYDDWGIPSDFGRPQSIRVDRDGFAEDFRGPRGPGGPLNDWTGLSSQLPMTNAYADRAHPETPWYPPQNAAMHTGYSAFQQPLPGAAPMPYGAPAQYPGASPYGHSGPYPAATAAPAMGYRGHQRQRSAHNTPWMGGGYLPVTPGAPTQGLPGGPPAERPDRAVSGLDTRWMTGTDYGPVLDQVLASIVKCQPKINPLLAPPPNDDSRDFLEWNMLFPTSYVHRSNDREDVSWMNGRQAPATFPRIKSLRIISRHFTWFIDVKSRDPDVGVTCGEVIDSLAKFFSHQAPKVEHDACSKAEQAHIAKAYYTNRSRSRDVPGGSLGQGLRRCDFLGDYTIFGGIEVDREYVRGRLQLGQSQRDFPCIFVLKCEGRLPQTTEELRTAEARSRSRNRGQSRVEDATDSDSSD